MKKKKSGDVEYFKLLPRAPNKKIFFIESACGFIRFPGSGVSRYAAGSTFKLVFDYVLMRRLSGNNRHVFYIGDDIFYTARARFA